jgi:hypothetical protein
MALFPSEEFLELSHTVPMYWPGKTGLPFPFHRSEWHQESSAFQQRQLQQCTR